MGKNNNYTNIANTYLIGSDEIIFSKDMKKIKIFTTWHSTVKLVDFIKFILTFDDFVDWSCQFLIITFVFVNRSPVGKFNQQFIYCLLLDPKDNVKGEIVGLINKLMILLLYCICIFVAIALLYVKTSLK